jgi:hypothetical protein
LQEHISGNGRACQQLQLGDRARWCLGDVKDIGQLRIRFDVETLENTRVLHARTRKRDLTSVA